MKHPRLSKLELAIMERLWELGPTSIREVHESLPSRTRSAYTTIQTTVYRLEAKGAVRRVKKIGNAHVFEATLSRAHAKGRLIDELLAAFGGRPQPMMAHLIETGRLTMDDLKEAERILRERSKGGRR